MVNASLLIKTLQTTTITTFNTIQTSHHPSITKTMSSILHKLKTVILDINKSLPETHITEIADFEIWGYTFITAMVCLLQEH
jgi:hypothetical protein